MSSVFVAPGTNARENQQNQQSAVAGQLDSLLPGEVAYQKQLQSFRNTQLPNMEQGVQNAYYNTTQGGRNAQTQAYGQQQNAAANEATGQAYSKFAGNPSLASGYGLDASNQANTNTGNYAAGLNSAQGENSAWGNYLSANSALSPSYQGADSLASGVYQQPAIQVGQGIGGFLGSALGSWAGAGYPSISGVTSQLMGSNSGLSANYPLGIPPVG